MMAVTSRIPVGIKTVRAPDQRSPGTALPGSLIGSAEPRSSLPSMRVDSRFPVRVAVATKGSDRRDLGDRWLELAGLLPPGSRICRLCGSVQRCRIEGRPESWLDASGVELWFREWQPDVLVFPQLEDLEFGILPLAWHEALRISLKHVLVNAVRSPSTVRERLLIRETMMSMGGFWPGVPDGCEEVPGLGFSRGLTWLVEGHRGEGELLRWKPRNAVKPRITKVDGVFNDSGILESAAGLATFLLGGAPYGLHGSSGK